MLRLVLVAALLVACSKKKEDAGPTCDQVADNLIAVTKQMLPGHGDQAMGDRKAMVAQCEQRKMPAAQRKCLVAAKTFDELAKCRGNEPVPAQRPAPVTPAAPPSAPPAPPPSPGSAAPAGSGG